MTASLGEWLRGNVCHWSSSCQREHEQRASIQIKLYCISFSHTRLIRCPHCPQKHANGTHPGLLHRMIGESLVIGHVLRCLL